jgi:integrator complex subunit 1
MLKFLHSYPTLRVMMEMIMTDDYNFPPQSTLTDEMAMERFRAIENQTCQSEKQEILEFENLFGTKQGLSVRFTETNSNLISRVMKFEPTGPPRRPPNELIQSIRKLNSEYKLGQLLCKSRQPDFLLSLIKRQNSKLSLPWLSSLIESSSNDCLEIMPIQCICEFIWNVLNGNEEITLKV